MPSTNAPGRVQFFEAEDKIFASRPACPEGLNVTDNMLLRQHHIKNSLQQLLQHLFYCTCAGALIFCEILVVVLVCFDV